MSRPPLQFSIVVPDRPGGPIEVKGLPAEATVASLLRLVLEALGRPGNETGWALAFQGKLLRLDATLAACFPEAAATVELTLRRVGPAPAEPDRRSPPVAAAPLPAAPAPRAPAPAPAAPAAPADEDEEEESLRLDGPAEELQAEESFDEDFEMPALDEEGSGVGLAPSAGKPPRGKEEDDDALALEDSEEESGSQIVALDDEDEAEAAVPARPRYRTGPPSGSAPAPKKKKAVRRAAVRHYSRMHPQRVYPLLVTITKGMVERVAKRGTDQRATGPFQVELGKPVEIEPVLPGCDCHPPRIVARLGAADLKVAFRVVPQVLGKVDGACVAIRQDHAVLAEVPLDIKVRRQLWVVLAGCITFALPCLSAILKHFGVNLDIQSEEGFNLYVGFARLIFDTVSPLALTAGLGVGTGLLWWTTRPERRDTFWDLETIGPAEKLKRIAALAEDDPDRAAGDLADLLQAFPDYRPALVYHAEWHFRNEDYAAALRSYEDALALGPGTAREHIRAAFAASKLGRNARALAILQQAVRAFPKDKVTGVLHYNMGCYQARLGQHDEALAALRRAVAAGYVKEESFRSDPDLEPLRRRADFRQLVAGLG